MGKWVCGYGFYDLIPIPTLPGGHDIFPFTNSWVLLPVLLLVFYPAGTRFMSTHCHPYSHLVEEDLNCRASYGRSSSCSSIWGPHRRGEALGVGLPLPGAHPSHSAQYLDPPLTPASCSFEENGEPRARTWQRLRPKQTGRLGNPSTAMYYPVTNVFCIGHTCLLLPVFWCLSLLKCQVKNFRILLSSHDCRN
jgi:hypothetical protein